MVRKSFPSIVSSEVNWTDENIFKAVTHNEYSCFLTGLTLFRKLDVPTKRYPRVVTCQLSCEKLSLDFWYPHRWLRTYNAPSMMILVVKLNRRTSEKLQSSSCNLLQLMVSSMTPRGIAPLGRVRNFWSSWTWLLELVLCACRRQHIYNGNKTKYKWMC